MLINQFSSVDLFKLSKQNGLTLFETMISISAQPVPAVLIALALSKPRGDPIRDGKSHFRPSRESCSLSQIREQKAS
jgi:hypothetical protein